MAVRHTAFVINTLEALSGQIIAIQGSIGAGKSTLLARVDHYLTENRLNVLDPNRATDGRSLFLLVPEPLQEWDTKIYPYSELPEDDCTALLSLHNANSLQQESDVDAMSTSGDENVMMASHFELVNLNPKRYGFSFQMNANTSRLANYLRILNDIPELPENTRVHIITERSMRSDYLFAENLHDMGFMSGPEWHSYKKNYAINTKSINDRESVMLYVNTDVDVCLERIAMRGRPSEQSIPREYMQNIHKKHIDLVDQFSGLAIKLDELQKNKKTEEIDEIVRDFMPKIQIYVDNCYT